MKRRKVDICNPNKLGYHNNTDRHNNLQNTSLLKHKNNDIKPPQIMSIVFLQTLLILDCSFNHIMMSNFIFVEIV